MAQLLKDEKDGKKVYKVRWKDETGKVKQKTFVEGKVKAPLRTAEDFRDLMSGEEAERKGDTPKDIPLYRGDKIPFLDVALEYLETRRTRRAEESTVKDHSALIRTHIVPWLEQRQKAHHIRAITTRDVEDFHDDLVEDRIRVKRAHDAKRPLAHETKVKLLRLLKTVLRYAKKKRYIRVAEVPGEKVKMDDIPADAVDAALAREELVFQRDEVYTLLRAADALANDQDGRRRKAWREGGYRALVYLLAYSGLRISECLAITYENLDLDAPAVHVRAKVGRYRTMGRPKSKKAVRTVILHKRAVEAIRNYLAWAEIADPPSDRVLFATETARPMIPRNVHQRCLEPLIQKANLLASDPDRTDKRLVPIEDVPGRGFHGFRRWVNSYLVHKGLNSPELRAMMGHETQAMTDWYTFVLDSLDPV